MLEGISWLGHASFKLAKQKTIVYIDPWKIKEKEPADIILITHSHYDHCSPEDIKKIQKDNTILVAPLDCAPILKGNVKIISPGEKLTIQGIEIEAIPAYNKGKPFHPKSSNFVGYVITISGLKIYHAGDTDFIPEMEKLNIDIALFPIGGTYTMNAEEAASAVNCIKPKVAIPMHYGGIAGSKNDAEKFKKLCQVEVEILKEDKNG
jgi:L-ascorbate metabolism protein UlaG (beta-lactamase superfamily)